MNIKKFLYHKKIIIALFSLVFVALHFVFRSDLPLFAVIIFGGLPLIYDLLTKAIKREFGADLLAGISILTSVFLGEYLAGAIVVFMLSGGEALEVFAAANASSVLRALAKRIPSIAHKKVGADSFEEVQVETLTVGDILVVHPHEVCPVDGNVVEGHGHMDESYLTGEPFRIEKAIGSDVLSGSVNGDTMLVIRANKAPSDSRYAKIMKVMTDSEQSRPRLRRLGDQLGAYYTPLALLVAIAAWIASGDPTRFLAVIVVATPCPLLIAIPIAIIGSVSLAAKRSIIIKTPLALEQITQCRTAIFDKTGTLTYGEPRLTEFVAPPGVDKDEVFLLVASLERYSKHPLASAILKSANEKKLKLNQAAEIHEPPGQGLTGLVNSRKVQVTSRKKLAIQFATQAELMPPTEGGLECVIVIDGRYAGILRFRDSPRKESKSFVSHLGPKHNFDKFMIISGDREIEVRHLAAQVGIEDVHAPKSPEEKLEIVRAETKLTKTLYVGDGINDAPAMMAATVGMAMGQNSEVTSEAASVVILDNSLQRVDEFIHISKRMRSIALQSAIGGMTLSLVGMGFASMGYLSPVNGAIAQEIIDVLAILNALRVAIPPKILTDFR